LMGFYRVLFLFIGSNFQLILGQTAVDLLALSISVEY
jgi:hypothetical protein